MTYINDAILLFALLALAYKLGVRVERKRINRMPPRTIVIGGQVWDVKVTAEKGTSIAPNNTPIGSVPHGSIKGVRTR